MMKRFRQKSGADWTLDHLISQSKIALGTRISSVSPRAMVQICPRAPVGPVQTPMGANPGTNSFYGCLTVSRKPFFRPQATSFCTFPRLPAAHFPVSSDLGTFAFSGRLTVSRKPFFRLQATSFCLVPRSPAAHLPSRQNTQRCRPPFRRAAESGCQMPSRNATSRNAHHSSPVPLFRLCMQRRSTISHWLVETPQARTSIPFHEHGLPTVMLNAVRATRYTHIQLMPLADTPLCSESSQVITGHFRLVGDAESSTPWFPDLRQPVVGRLEYRQI